MSQDNDVYGRMGTLPADAYLIRRKGEPTARIIGGAFRWVGHYWNRQDNGWNDYTMPRDVFTVAERETFPLPEGGEWVGIFYNNGGR
jgi:hypothetical protein